ncbi:NAD-dependent epimerase/dehydratase family protein [Butyrivibrio sp. AD3002]|uniref:NAD-dependent epimerase/dehydratase family protein n=1 Tax=Butyrivibrio sp. AD3002 TaxID=1280670 RepID=UPI0003B50FA3|nr:NAD(P)-dependent oxidoreductase [Butyrivibrio sp. AD3002]
MSLRKVIVTGANGFIGSKLCEELTSQGIEVIAIIRNEEENITAIKDLPGLKIVYCDLSDFRNLADYVEDRDVDAFYHLAWVGSAGPLRGDDVVQVNNVRYTCDTVRACSDMSCKRFIFASSIMEYEISALMETMDSPGINTLYSSAKIAADYMARTIAASLDVEYMRTVISNIYGPGETSPRLVNTSIRKLLRKEHCAFSPGEQMYDFIYIDDAVKAFVAIGEKGKNNGTYYVGSLSPKPLKEFLIELRDAVDPTAEIGLGDIPFGGVSLGYDEFDIYAIKNDTGFVPSVSFTEGIKNTAAWIKEADNL